MTRRFVAILATFALVGLLAAPSLATPDTLRRSVENLTQWPGDIIISPWTSGVSIYNNLRDVDDSLGVKIAYPLPGYVWNLMVNIGAGVLRGVTGALELLPGVVLLFTDADMDPLFDPADENYGLVNWENGYYNINFGINYTGAGY